MLASAVRALEPVDKRLSKAAADEESGGEERVRAGEPSQVDHADRVLRGEAGWGAVSVVPLVEVVRIVLFEVVQGVLDELGHLILLAEADSGGDDVERRAVVQKGTGRKLK